MTAGFSSSAWRRAAASYSDVDLLIILDEVTDYVREVGSQSEPLVPAAAASSPVRVRR